MALRTRGQIVAGGPPRVSLLPPAQRAALRHEKIMPRLVATVIASAVVAVLIAGAGFAVATVTQQRLTAIDLESAELVTQLAGFGETQQLLNQSASLTKLRQDATKSEVLFIDLQDEISREMPEGAALVGLSVLPGPGDPAAELAPALCGSGVANLTVTIRSPRFTAPADLVDSLSSVTGYQCAMVTSSALDETPAAAEGEEAAAATVTTTITLTVGEEALSARFAAKEAN